MNTKRFTIIIFISLVLGCLGCGSDASYSSSQNDNSNDTQDHALMERACSAIGLPVRVINGESCGNLAAASVVRIIHEIDLGDRIVNMPACTGTLIQPNVVLTAAHCLKFEQDDFPIVGMGVFIGEQESGRYIPAIGLSAPGSYHLNTQVQRLFDDALLLVLAESVSNPIMPLLISRIPEIGESGFVYGYGAREQGDTSSGRDFLSLEAGAMRIANVTQNHIFVTFDGKGVNVCNGDSGGPIVVMVNGQPALAGITSQGNVNGCSAGDVTTFTNIHSPGVLNWLADSLPGLIFRSESESINFKVFDSVEEVFLTAFDSDQEHNTKDAKVTKG